MVDSLADLREVHRRALALGATEMRPVSHGNAWSIYFKDPEGNTVEAYLDTPFHVPQPHGKPLDLSKSDEEILRETEAACRKDPGFMPMTVSSARWRTGWAPEPDARPGRPKPPVSPAPPRRTSNRGGAPPTGSTRCGPWWGSSSS